MWFPKENKYARKSLGTRSERTVIERGKAAYLEIYANLQQGKSCFSISTKEGVEKYLNFRQRDVELGHIVRGRHTTIAIHLQHFLSYIGKDTKLKELERTDCENYYYHCHKATNGNVKRATVQNEQSTINALMRWLHKNGETHIDGFDFRKLPRLDKGNEAIRRATLTNNECENLYRAMRSYCVKHTKLDDAGMRRLIVFSIFVSLSLKETPAYAYLGPGMAGGVFSAVVGIAAAIFMILLGIVYYPIKRHFSKKKDQKENSKEEV